MAIISFKNENSLIIDTAFKNNALSQIILEISCVDDLDKGDFVDEVTLTLNMKSPSNEIFAQVSKFRFKDVMSLENIFDRLKSEGFGYEINFLKKNLTRNESDFANKLYFNYF